MLLRCLTLLIAGTGTVSAQDPAPQAPQAIEILRPPDPAFDALVLKYGVAVLDYDEARSRIDLARDGELHPPHPAKAFLGDFQALAAKDSGAAQGWILEKLRFAADEPAEKLRLAREIFPKLLASHVDEDGMLHALDGLRAVYEDLGEAVVIEMATAIARETHVNEIRGQAKLLQAWVLTKGDSTQNPERWKDATEIYRDILYTIPRTRAGLQVAGILFRNLEKEFFARERKWVDTLLELQAQGRSPDEWPRQPMHDFLLEFQPLANTGYGSAQKWVGQLYPSYAQVERQGLGLAYAWLANKFGELHSDGLDGPWNALRLDLLTVLYRQFPTERWVFDSVRKLLSQVEILSFDHLGPGMEALLEKNQEPRVRAAALFAMAQSIRARGDQRSYERAIELYTRVRDEFPDDALRQAAEGGRAELARVMPGQRAPPTQAQDATGLTLDLAEYKGRAVMLEFWSLTAPACLEAIPLRAELFEKYPSRPFSLLGINTDSRKSGPFHDAAAKLGVRWRCASISPTAALLTDWVVQRQPTTVLIDKNGIIRGRDLPWPEMVALTEVLVAEAESSAPGNAVPPK